MPLRPVPFPRAMRGVYEQPATVNGHRVFISVKSDGEQNGLKTVLPGTDAKWAICQLWDDLERDDPIMPDDAAFPALRMIPRSFEDRALE